ncbi:MAG: dprA [Ilumatobacteraceae bacterium]|nr:dprA [Ilumatobacteraceae bacterium]
MSGSDTNGSAAQAPPVEPGADLPEQAWAAALSIFPAMSLHRLTALLRGRSPSDAFAVATGRRAPRGMAAKVLADAELRERWRRHGASCSIGETWDRCQEIGAHVTYVGASDYPALLATDRDPPPVLFVRGDTALFDEGRRVAIVGTRNATAAGRGAAFRIGADLTAAGVHVVSGLARGIDGCAHRGAAETGGPGRPIGVVASGLDVVYPREHRQLWEHVVATGLLVSEAAPGTSPEAFRFPLRNRIIAALAEVVVVVESREKGGSLITAAAAGERGIPVMAVPGALHSHASFGTNNLLREGSGAVVDASDVLIALSLEHRRAVPVFAEQRARPRRDDLAVYEACASEPRTVDSITLCAGIGFVETAMSLARLEQAGWLGSTDGWYQAIGAPLR